MSARLCAEQSASIPTLFRLDGHSKPNCVRPTHFSGPAAAHCQRRHPHSMGPPAVCILCVMIVFASPFHYGVEVCSLKIETYTSFWLQKLVQKLVVQWDLHSTWGTGIFVLMEGHHKKYKFHQGDTGWNSILQK